MESSTHDHYIAEYGWRIADRSADWRGGARHLGDAAGAGAAAARDQAAARAGRRADVSRQRRQAAEAASVAQRRDMHFAAQISRRLGEMDGLGLQIPDVYRDYSTGRCVTFEAPAEFAPPTEAHYREIGKRVPVGRIADASEFADLVAFLASERASYITGTAVNFDGGMSFTV